MAFVPIYILILGGTIVIDYFAGIQIERSGGKKRYFFLICSLIANIGILAFFKYYNFLNSNLSALLHITGHSNPLPYLSILLPIGLSFHTFQAMSYTIEVYRGKQKAERHFGIYALYVMFYPQLVAGPIERPQNMIYQFYEKHDFEYGRVTNGLKLMLWGFFKKIVIADNLALISNNIFDHYQSYKGGALIVGTLAFTVQIFCDFSGYSDIAIGAAKVMGIELMTNFRMPYCAESISEFWTRWHISLSTWFKDYLYIPLGGNRVSLLRWVFNILVVFILSGLWHGANWTFIIWGLLHGFYLIFDRYINIFSARFKSLSKLNDILVVRLLKMLVTFVLVAFAWIFFRSKNWEAAKYIILNLFKGWQIAEIHSALSIWGAGALYPCIIIMFIAILIGVGLYKEHRGSVLKFVSAQPIGIRWSLYFFLVFSIACFGMFGNIKFIYFQF
jgi:D-alanyl-lipoteichoic acid acyltransferase DltB (MBOAT superfamily)